MKRLLILGMSLALLGNLVLAQDNLDDSLFGGGESSEETNEDDLFGGGDELFGDSIFTEVEEDPDANPADALLVNEGVTIGGSFGVTAEIDLSLNPEEDEDAFSSGLTDLSTRIFLDARPNSDFRAFAKGDIAYDTADGVSFDLREAFADIDIDNAVFIRAGKQTINWGVGFFFSPANLINLETIDPENTGAELAGPVALKAQVPLGIDNFTGYMILDEIESGNDIGLAARYEFLAGGYEFTVGGVWRNENPWALMATVSGNIQGIDYIEDVAVFGEVVVEGNSGKTFIVEDSSNPLGYSTEAADSLYFSATVGARADYTTDDDLYTISGSAQYFFNGLGYADPSVFVDEPQVVGAFLGQGALTPSDLIERGQHYAAINISSPDIAESGFTPGLLWLGNLSDGSGFVNTSVSYNEIDNFTPGLSYRYNYGAEGAEYSPMGDSHSLKLTLNISGDF